MKPDKNRSGFPVEIKELKADGLSSESREQLLLEKERRRHLLLEIDTKYGDIDKAEGSPELEELRELIGAKA